MRLLLLRHAATAWTATGQHTSRTDLELTPDGAAEARSAAGSYADVLGPDCPLAAVYSSPRRRALQTAELVLGGSRKPSVDAALAEFDYGEYEGLTLAEIHARAPGWSIWDDGCPGGESVAAVGARVDGFIARLRARHGDETVCAVSHGHLLRILTARLLGLPPENGRLFAIHTCALAEVCDKEDRLVLAAWNRTPKTSG